MGPGRLIIVPDRFRSGREESHTVQVHFDESARATESLDRTLEDGELSEHHHEARCVAILRTIAHQLEETARTHLRRSEPSSPRIAVRLYDADDPDPLVSFAVP